MSYVEQNLMNGESIIYEARLHWIILLFSVISMGIGLFIIFLSSFIFTWVLNFWPVLWQAIPKNQIAVISGWSSSIFFGLGLLQVASAFLGFISSVVQMMTSEFVVTNRRIIAKTGAIRRNTTELLLHKIESINVKQSVWGRMFDYGTIVITGTGTTHEPFNNIAQPLQFRQQIQNQIFAQPNL